MASTPSPITNAEFAHISTGHATDPSSSMSLHADAYTEARWFALDQQTLDEITHQATSSIQP